jgi:hypothetical protein
MAQRHAMVHDPNMAQAIKVLRAGGSRSQQNRAMADKALLAAGTMGLTAAGGIYSGIQSEKLQAKNAAKTQAGNIAAEDAAIRKSAAPYAAGEYKPPAEGDQRFGQMPSWLETAQGQGDAEAVKLLANQALANQKMNVAAAGANIGGYRTPSGLTDIEDESDVRAADISTAKNMMKMGGMMNSLARTGGPR